MAAAPCHHSKDQPAPTHRGRDRLRRRRQRPSQVRSKTSRAHPCEASGALLLSNGGDRGRPCRMHPLAAPGALWVLSRAGKVPRPPAGGRNFPQEMDFLWMARKEASLLSSVSQGFASAEATKGLSARPLETFGALLLKRMGGPQVNWFLVDGREGGFLAFLRFAGVRLCGGDQRAFRSPFGNLRGTPFEANGGVHKLTGFLWMAGKEASLLSSVSRGFASAEATKGLSARPLETFGALCC